MTAVRVELLGPLRLFVDGRPVEVPGHRRRAVLAMLATAGGHPLGVDSLIDAIWPDDPPETGHQAVHSHISRLRRHLGPAAGRLQRLGAGYCLDLGDDETDLAQVRRLGRELAVLMRSDPAEAVRTATAALSLWRGTALEEFADIEPLAAEAVGLAELYVRLRDDALEARLAAGERSVAADAAAAARDEPMRERTATLLVRALATEGRTAEAMAAASTYRRRLTTETGLDPGPALGALEREVAAGTLAPQGLSSSASSVPAHPSRLRTVPRPTGPMVGRDHDRADLHRLLEGHRAVTVTGPGGVGKTRLVLDVAADLSQGGADVAVVTLAEVTDAARVPDAVASTLGISQGGQASPVSVADALAERDVLLVLDNGEHVAAACRELVTAVLARAPDVRVVTTSRVTLHLPGEYVVRLQPLPLPRDVDGVESLAQQPGVRAFVEHARRRNRAFVLAPADGPAVVEIVRRLDGLPLAIELAAGQVAVLPVEALRSRLGRALDALRTERAEPDARQRTLRATVDWSYQLLDGDGRALLRALATFPGGADLATVEEIAAETVPGIDPLVVLGRLVDASLLSPDEQSTGRFTLLETVRAFLLDELDACGERDEADRRFVDWARRTTWALAEALSGPDEPAADRRLRAELANLRSARDLARARGDFEVLVNITRALDEETVWRDVREIWVWAQEVADDERLKGHPQEVLVLGRAAQAAWLQGDRARAERLSSLAFEVAARPDSPAGPDQLRTAYSAAGAVALFAGDYDEARSCWLRAAALSTHNTTDLASAALAAAYAGEETVAREVLDRAWESAAAWSCPSEVAFTHYVEGELAARSDPAAAVAAYTRAVEIARSSGGGFVDGIATVGLASVWTSLGNVEAAARGYRLLLDYWQRTGNATQFWTTARNAARLLADHGHEAEAALLLAAADASPSAAVLTGEDAVRTQLLWSRLEKELGATTLNDVLRGAAAVGRPRIIDVARQALVVLG